jgi:hypothetical protein
MEMRLGATGVHYYELGSGTYGGSKYPAVAVGAKGLDTITTTVGAKLSAGASYTYGNSVQSGVDELSAYMTARMASCPTTKFVLGGYSQGAQVMGQAFSLKFTTVQRNAVVFSMLFGDPKLNLPEGRGGFLKRAPACRGEGLSPWRRDVPDCGTDNGSLGAREPYLPAGADHTTGLWCADDDFVCGSSKNMLVTSGHYVYANPGGAIDQGVLEAAQRFGRIAPPGLTPPHVSWAPPKGGSAGLDVVILIDSTGSMIPHIAGAKAVARDLAEMVISTGGRIALAEYRDAGDIFTARLLTGLEGNDANFLSYLSGIGAGGGGDSPEAMLHALKTVMLGVDWRPGATKAVIVLTDAPYHSPDRVDGTTEEEVIRLSLEIDPVNIYPVVANGYTAAYEAIAAATTGQVLAIDSGTSAADALADAMGRITERPVPLLALNAYYGEPGQEVFFDASRSYSPTSEIVKWDWDFDGDGIYEVEDGEPTAQHTYADVFKGNMQVRLTDADGLIANVSAPVDIDYAAVVTPEPPAAADLGAEVTSSGETAAVTWAAAVDPGMGWLVSLDGAQLGLLQPGARSLVLEDLNPALASTLMVQPVALNGEVGLAATAQLGLPGAGPNPGGGTGVPGAGGQPGSGGNNPAGGAATGGSGGGTQGAGAGAKGGAALGGSLGATGANGIDGLLSVAGAAIGLGLGLALVRRRQYAIEQG